MYLLNTFICKTKWYLALQIKATPNAYITLYTSLSYNVHSEHILFLYTVHVNSYDYIYTD